MRDNVTRESEKPNYDKGGLRPGLGTRPGLSAVIVGVCAAYAATGGLITFLGYLLDIPRFTDWNNSGISMFPNAAGCAVLSGITLFGVDRKSSGRWRTIWLLLGCIVTVIGGLTLLEHLTDVNLGIDTVLFQRTWGQRASDAPMRMGLPASTSFFILGLALVFAASGSEKRRIASISAIILAAIASLSVVGYSFGADQLFGISRLTGIALPTSTILAALSVGLTAAIREVGLAALMRRQDAGGLLARRLLPAIVIFPILFGWLRVLGQQQGLFDTAFGTAALVLTTIMMLVALLWWTGAGISRQTEITKRAEEESREQRERLRVTLASIGDAVIATDVHGMVSFLNPVASILTGWSKEEALGAPLESVFHIVNDQTREPVENPALRAMRDGAIVGLANHTLLISKDGTEKPIDDAGSPIRNAESQTIGSVLIFRDITQRRLVEKEREGAGRVARQLAALVESSDDAIIATDLDLRITAWNRAAERMYGYTAKEAVGQPLSLIIPEDRLHEEDGLMNRIRHGEKVEHFETERCRKDKTIIGVSITLSPIHDSAGIVIGASKIARDITERLQAKRLQAELFERERLMRLREHSAREAAEAAELRLRMALDAGHMGGWEYNVRTGRVIWSPGLEQIHGYQAGTFPGTFDAFREEIHPDDREHVLQAIGEATAQKRDHHIEYRIVRKDGSIRWVEGRGQLFLNDDGLPDRMLGVCADITERKRAEEMEKQARLAAEEANRLKDEFLAMVSHELRNPLSAILGWSAILNKGNTPDERAKQAYAVIERNARAEARLVESLLDLSRITAGQLKLDSERVNLPVLLEVVVDSIRPAADDKGIALEMTSQRDIVLIGDSGRLQQVFSNLLTNAVKFTSRGGRIQVRVARSGSHAHIQVVDDGEGISPGFIPYVFERFRQAESTAARTQGGLGLGLAIVRELVRAHGGSITAESPGKGHGSTFTVTLPVPAVMPAHIEAARSTLVQTEIVSLMALPILVVDDDPDARELIGITLESRGTNVQLASSASEALLAISRNRPEVLIADIDMPQEDGYVLIQTLRALEREHAHSRLPAVALTAHTSPADRDKALAAGYDVHLAKPVEPDYLMQCLARFPRAKQRDA